MFFLDTEEALDIAPAPLPNSGLLHPRRPGIHPLRELDYNRANKFNSDVSALFYNFGGGLVDVVNRRRPSFSDVPNRVDAGGIKSEMGGGNLGIRFANDPHYAVTGAVSFCIVFDLDTRTNYSALFDCADSATTNGYEIRGGFNTPTDGKPLYHRANAGGYKQWHASTIQLQAGTKDNFLFISDPGGVIDDPINFMNVNGNNVSLTSNQNGSVTAPMAASSEELRIGRREDGVTYLDGAIKFIGIFKRDLNFEQSEMIRRDIYQFLKPKLDILAIQSRNVPGGFMLPTSVARPRRPGVKPTWPVEVDWLHPIAKGLTGAIGVGHDPYLNLSTNRGPISKLNASKESGKIRLSGGYLQYADFFPATDDNGWTVIVRASASIRAIVYLLGWGAATQFAGPHLGFAGSNQVRYAVWGDGVIDTPSAVTDDDYHIYQIHLTPDSVGTIYVDGVQKASGALNASNLSSATGYIGALPNGASPWNGGIDYVFAWDRKLTDGELAAIYKDPYQFLIPKL